VNSPAEILQELSSADSCNRFGSYNFSQLREYTEHIKIISFTQSPVSFIMLFFGFRNDYQCPFGIEPLVRSTTIVLPIVAIGVVIVVADSVKNSNFQYNADSWHRAL